MNRKLRWAMDGGFWDLDLSTPSTLNGIARPVPGDPLPLPLSRGVHLSRPKQIDFFHRFMFMPVVPSYSPAAHGLSIHRVLSVPFALDRWFGTLLSQFNIQKLVSSIRDNGLMQPSESSWLQSIGRHLSNRSLYAFDLCSEFFITPDDTMLLSSEVYGDDKKSRQKAVFHHKFPKHNLTLEAAWPGLFVDKDGSYWDVPFTMAVDLASVASDTGASYHMCINQTSGSAQRVEGQINRGGAAEPASLLPGLSATAAVSYKKDVDMWTSKAPMLKMVQPYDMFMSNPHISASGLLGAVVTASLGNNSMRAQVEDELTGFKGFRLRAKGENSAVLADLFGSVALSAQYGNFQRLFLDLTRFNARLDFPSGSTFISGATLFASDLYKSRSPCLEVIQAMCPKATLSLQQQIAGPISFRVDSGVAVDLKKRDLRAKDPVFAIEYALQVLGSAKAVAWFTPKQKEFMVELRFFET